MELSAEPPPDAKRRKLVRPPPPPPGEPKRVKLVRRYLPPPAPAEPDAPAFCSKSSSGSEFSESEYSESEPSSADRGSREEIDVPVPKLTIKPVVRPDESECRPAKKSSTDDSQSDGPSQSEDETPSMPVPKLIFKPLHQPPIEKMTIKINKPTETKSEATPVDGGSTVPDSIPKMLIKLNKPAADSSQDPPRDLDDREAESNEGALKMTIKINKNCDDAENFVEYPCVKKVIHKNDRNAEPSVPKLTIKIPPDFDSKSPERAVSSPVPKLTIKIPPDFDSKSPDRAVSSPVPKITIKPVVKPDETRRSPPIEIEDDEGADSGVSDSDVVELEKPSADSNPLKRRAEDSVDLDRREALDYSPKMKSKARNDDRTAVDRRSAKYFSKSSNDVENIYDDDEEISTNFNCSENNCEDLREASNIPKVTIKAIPVPESMTRPLEIETSPFRSTPERQESGQESPRIILKINKTVQGPTSEILTEKTLKREGDRDDVENASREPSVPKITIKIPPETVDDRIIILDGVEDVHKNDTNNLSPVGRIKLKLTKEGGCAIVSPDSNNGVESFKDGSMRTGKSAVKQQAPLREDPDLLNMCIEKAVMDAKRLKLNTIFANSNLTITRTGNSELENLLKIDSRPDVSRLSINAVDQRISPDANKRQTRNASNSSKTNTTLPKIDPAKFANFANMIETPKTAKKAASKRSTRISNYKKGKSRNLDIDFSITSANTSEDAFADIDRLKSESPVFNMHVNDNVISLNEGSSSQECIILDDLSQDPLDIGSIAKSHFVPGPIAETIAAANNNLVNLLSKPSEELTPKPRRGRGRPRKSLLKNIDDAADCVIVPEERNLRNSRTPRETPARTSRGRGRGRGAKRAALHNAYASNSISTNNSAYFPNMSIDEDDKECETASNVSGDQSKSIGERVNSDNPDDSDVQSIDSDMSASDPTSPGEWNISDAITKRGRGRGRGGRRRGGRTPRSAARGNRNARGNRGVKHFEEVQVQDAAPVSILKDGLKSKLKSVHSSSLQLFEEETCMMGDLETQYNKNADLIDEESQNSEIMSESPKSKKSRLTEVFDDGHKEWVAADVAEYDWPPEGCAPDSPPQTLMIQEQVALYLGVKSFKRKYPDLNRRPLDPEEKIFLRERNLISEAMCDLGVTAVDAGEVLDIMFTDFPAKYEEYRQHLRETRDTRAANRPPPTLTTERSKQETFERACQEASSWNARFNRQRRTMRTASMDLQTLTLHRPRQPQAVSAPPVNISHYPVALLPGQYTDFYRIYSSDELRYFPLNTVLSVMHSPVRVDEDSQPEESAEESDAADSSSDGSDSESSERNFKRKNMNPKSKSRGLAASANDATASRPNSPSIQSHVAPSALPPPPTEVPRCKLCSGTEHANRRYPTEQFITCATCQKKIHPSCLEMAPAVAKCVRMYEWQCADCKCCGHCDDLADDDKMLFCDLCDRGYHIYCVGLKKVPNGRWHCSHCAICRSCGARSPAGPPGTANLSASTNEQWHHHLKKGSSGQKIYSHTLCGPCARAWRAGRYCSLCERCFMGKKGALKVVICVNCDRTHHKDCVRQPGRTLDVLNYMCNGCRRGNTPRRYAAPRKNVRRRTSQPATNNTESIKSEAQNNTPREPINSMDLSVDSICTNDSNHQTNNAYDGTYEESISNSTKTGDFSNSKAKRNIMKSTNNANVSSNHLEKLLTANRDPTSNSLEQNYNDTARKIGENAAATAADEQNRNSNELNISHKSQNNLKNLSNNISNNIETFKDNPNRNFPLHTDNASGSKTIIQSKTRNIPMEVDVQYDNVISEKSSIEMNINDLQNSNNSHVK